MGTKARLLGALCALVVAVAAACGGGDDKGNAPATGAPAGTTKAPGATTPGVQPTSAGASAKLPANVCALLTPAEVQTLAPSLKVPEGKPTSSAQGIQSVSCSYEWQDPTLSAGFQTFDVKVYQFPPGVNAAAVKLGWQVEAKDAKENGTELSGIGDFAIYISVINGAGEGRAIVKGVLLEVEFLGNGARAQKDKVVALLKAAASRI